MIIHSQLGIVILVLLVVLIVGSVPAWPHSRSWGVAPSGLLGLVLILVLLLLLI